MPEARAPSPPPRLTLVDFEAAGPTLPVALLRVIVGALMLSRFGEEFSLHRALTIGEFAYSIAFYAAAVAVTIGLRTRLALIGASTLLALTYYGAAFGWERPGWGHHHHYLMLATTVLLIFSGAERSLSADRWLAARRGEAPEERARLWPRHLLVLQLVAVYFWAAVDKTGPGYLAGDWLERVMEWTYAGGAVYDLVTHRVFLVGASISVLIVEYALPVAILYRWRLEIVIPVALALHAVFYLMLPVQTYSAQMMALYLIVPNAERVDRLLRGLVAPSPASGNDGVARA